MSKDMKFSYYPGGITNLAPDYLIDIQKMHEMITTNIKLEAMTNKYRAGEADKNGFSYVTVSGECKPDRRDANLINYTGLICVDLDDIDIRLKDTIAGDMVLNTVLIYISPGGHGLKIVIRVNGGTIENHEAHFTAIGNILHDRYDIPIKSRSIKNGFDPSCKNVSRAAYLAHDDKPYFNPDGGIDSSVLLAYSPSAAVLPVEPVKPAVILLLPRAKIPDDYINPSERLNRLPAIEERAKRALENAGWTFAKDGENCTRPGKDPKTGTSGKLNRNPKDGLMYFTNFSSALESGIPAKGYTAVQMICELEFGGDWSTCISELKQEYFPDEQRKKTSSKSVSLVGVEVPDDIEITTTKTPKRPATPPLPIDGMPEDSEIYYSLHRPKLLSSTEFTVDIWLFAVKKNRQTGEKYPELKSIFQDGFRRKLASMGYYKRYIDDTQAIFIREQSNIIEEVKLVNIKDAVNSMLDAITKPFEILFKEKNYSFNPDQLRQIFYKAHNVYVCDSFLEYLPNHTRPILRDTRNEAYFYFNNAVARVTAKSIDLIPYHELPDGCIWKDQLIKRDFKIKDYEISHYERFIDNICNQDKARKLSAVSVIGYLLHNYHKPDDTQTIVANDEEVTDGKTPQGRTGKKILVEAIKQMRSCVFIDGKMLKPDDKFVFDNVTDSTQCVWIDDVKKDFDFSILHAVSTNGLSPEVKFKTKFHIPFERSPKFYLTSNLAINDEGKTNKARMFVLEFSNHYSQNIVKGSESPIKDEHGCYFFTEDWDPAEWNRFDSFMLECVLNYLQKGLLDYKREGLAKNKLMQSTSRDFYEWVQSQNFQPGIEYETSRYFEDFKDTYYGKESDFKQRGFTNWLKIAAQSRDWTLKTGRSNHVGHFKF